MSQCPSCGMEAGKDKRGRPRICCSFKCVILHSAKRRRMKEKECIGCRLPYIPKHRQSQKFCSRSCKAKTYWESGICRVPPEISYKNLKHFPYEGKDKLGTNRYKRVSINGKMVKEHRMVMEEYLGRKLESWEHIHHINENPSDNRLENLQIVTNSEHGRIHKGEK